MEAYSEITAPDLYRRRRRIERLRATAIDVFQDRQSAQRDFVSLALLAKIISVRHPSTGSADPDAWLNALKWLTEQASLGSLSKMLRVGVGYPITRFWLENPEKAPRKAFVTPEELSAWIETHGLSV